MQFTKMQGTGNDYIYVDARTSRPANPGALSARLSDRHFGIGADGLILICPSSVADARMEMYNADGSRGKMCGNGIRCVGKYIYEHGWTHETQIKIETDAGVKELTLAVADGKVESVCVDMGPAIFEPAEIPLLVDDRDPMDFGIVLGGEAYDVSVLSMGNPHCVLIVEHVEQMPVAEIGPLFENSVLFPEGVNTEFVEVIDEHTLRMRVWERGSGETMACGTGACASAVTGICKGLVKNPVTLRLNGGDLEIRWDAEENRVFMTGPAEEVFGGEIDVEGE